MHHFKNGLILVLSQRNAALCSLAHSIHEYVCLLLHQGTLTSDYVA